MYLLPTIFNFIGDYDELCELRSVCRYFKDTINKKCICSLTLSEDNSFVLYLYNRQLTVLICRNMDLKSLPELPMNRVLHCSENMIETIPFLSKNHSATTTN